MDGPLVGPVASPTCSIGCKAGSGAKEGDRGGNCWPAWCVEKAGVDIKPLQALRNTSVIVAVAVATAAQTEVSADVPEAVATLSAGGLEAGECVCSEWPCEGLSACA